MYTTKRNDTQTVQLLNYFKLSKDERLNLCKTVIGKDIIAFTLYYSPLIFEHKMPKLRNDRVEFMSALCKMFCQEFSPWCNTYGN